MEVFNFYKKPTNGDIVVFEKGKWTLVNKNSVLIPLEAKVADLKEEINELNARICSLKSESDKITKEINAKLASYHEALQILLKEL